MNDTKEMTVREATVFALESSMDEFSSIKERFKQVSEAFDTGRDSDGLDIIKDELIIRLSNLYEFCFTLLNTFDVVIGKDIAENFMSTFEKLDHLMKELSDETAKGNFTEVGDILRFDFFDLISELEILFPKLTESFKTSDRPELDKY